MNINDRVAIRVLFFHIDNADSVLNVRVLLFDSLGSQNRLIWIKNTEFQTLYYTFVGFVGDVCDSIR